jgi:hypothetical protein
MFKGSSALRTMVLAGLAALMLTALGAQSAWAEAATTCVKATKVTTPKKHFTGGWNDKGCTSVNGTHEGKYEKLASFTAPEEAQLKALIKYMTVQSSGVGGKPTVKLTGANLQVASGPKENETNGTGNVVIGADESPKAQTGSNNLVLGGEFQEFTSYGGILAGAKFDKISAPFASVLGGFGNFAGGAYASVSGGQGNLATGEYASVSGGEGNTASGKWASVSGGRSNMATNPEAASSVSGGRENTASGYFSSVSGGEGNTASGFEAASSVSGGRENTAGDFFSSVSGGEKNVAGTESAWIGGGYKNETFSKGTAGEEGFYVAIFGGKENKVAKNYEAIP